MMVCTVAFDGESPTSDAVITSPSGSTSLPSTGRIVVRPGRTPNASSFGCGGRFGWDRSAMNWSTCSGFVSSASASSPSASSGIWTSQSSTFWYSSAAIHNVPADRSLSTITCRFTRYSRRACGSIPSRRVSRSRSVPSQSRTTWPVEAHAPYVHDPRRTGAAGTPWAARRWASPPFRGWVTSASVVATTTSPDPADGCWSRACSAPSTATVRPPGSTSCEAERSRTTGSSPTAVTSTSAPFPTGRDVDAGSPRTAPLLVVSTVHRAPVEGIAAKTVPSSDTVSAPSPPTSAVGSSFSASNEVAPSNGRTHSRPSSPSRIAVVAPPEATCAPAGRRICPVSLRWATSTGDDVLVPWSSRRTRPASCCTSNDALPALSVPSIAWDS
ncbi:Uncharacterised protein [Mycobacteroides abscessus]|nr:Uncharacterised protein [Mycobacteroides abscessus]